MSYAHPMDESIDPVAVIDGLRRRLSAAEQERDLNAESLRLTSEALQNEEDKADAAEARVEALSKAAERFRAAIDAPSNDGWLNELNAADAELTAALSAGQEQ